MPQRSAYKPGTVGDVVVTISSYLARLREDEAAKPMPQRRPVPTIEDLATAIGVHPSTMSRMVNQQTELLNKRMLGKVIGVLRNVYGFPTQVGDVLAYTEEALDGSDDGDPPAPDG